MNRTFTKSDGSRQVMTPYRKGLAAGYDFKDACTAYLSAGGYKSGLPQPALPTNPYDPIKQRKSYKGFAEGVKRGVA
jgi:hypothetical protein